MEMCSHTQEAGVRPACRTRRGKDECHHMESLGDSAEQWGLGRKGGGGL